MFKTGDQPLVRSNGEEVEVTAVCGEVEVKHLFF